MNKKFLTFKLLCLLLVVNVTAVVTYAGETLVASSEYAGNDDKTANVEVGYRFKTGTTVRMVGSLGFIDISNAHDGTFNGDGLESDVTVRLWKESTATKIAEVTIPAGTSAELRDNFRYMPISVITLEPETNYVLSYDAASVDDHYLQANTSTNLNTYFVGSNDNTTWEIRWGTSGEMPTSTASWGLGRTYGCVNLQSPDIGAHDPEPASGDTYVGDPNGSTIDVLLKWKTGLDPTNPSNPNPNITSHLLYVAPNSVPFDANFPSVTPVNIPAGSPVDANVSYLKTGLDYNQLYYWKVDEVLGGDPCHVIGDIWSFTTKHTAPEIMVQPESVLAEDGDTVTFSVGVRSVATPHYSWKKSTDAKIGGDPGVGTDSNTLTISNVSQASDEAWYYVTVTNGTAYYNTSELVHLWFKEEIGRWRLNNNFNSDITTTYGQFNAEWDAVGDPCTALQSFDTNAIEGSHSVNFPGDVNVYATVIDSNDFFNNYVVGLTASCWVRASDITGWQGIMAKQSRNTADSAGEDWQGWTFSTNGGIPYFNLRNSGGDLTTTTEIDDGKWHMLTATYDPNIGTKLYLDGRRVAVDNTVASENVKGSPKDRLVIGAQDPNGPAPYPFSGQIDDVRIFTYPVTSTDVAMMYTEHVTDSICIDEIFPVADYNKDCKVDFEDLATLSAEWLICNLYPASACDN